MMTVTLSCATKLEQESDYTEMEFYEPVLVGAAF